MANSSKERLCGAGAPLGHANGFPPSVYPFAFSGGIRRSPPFEVLANGGFFRSFPTDLPKEMASLYKKLPTLPPGPNTTEHSEAKLVPRLIKPYQPDSSNSKTDIRIGNMMPNSEQRPLYVK
ncbi:hypothetical protein XELAEV_18016062mg [Xenopus laevis]|uniref:Uncharacterized protein n=1 Tax=Xenopus laevis TaxID=8355 RepID=A0A974DL49_XENLA|nr:hypothetical protein XELAEV_18016062mg [Xenopus laevis]